MLIPVSNGHYVWIGHWSPEIVEKEKGLTFVFGDNSIGKGYAGQAVIRDCKNTFGLVTKRYPSTDEHAYLSDINLDLIESTFAELDKLISEGAKCVFHVAGYGTGLAQLAARAPKLLTYIDKRISEYTGVKFGDLRSVSNAIVNVNTSPRSSDVVYVGRPSILCNPFIIGLDGDRSEVIEKYQAYLLESIRLGDKEFIDYMLNDCEGKGLGCHCHPEACHAEVIARCIAWLKAGLFDVWMKTPVNIYSQSEDTLGRMLSNFYSSTVSHPEYGDFATIEGFWHWLSTGCQFNEYRTMNGFSAKQAGTKMKDIKVPVPYFEDKIMEMIKLKILQNPAIFRRFVKSSVPFEHKYVYGDRANAKVVDLPKYKWIVDGIEALRQEFQKQTKVIIAGGREITDPALVERAIKESGFNVNLVISGLARGVDTLGKDYANKHDIDCARYPANWNKYKKAAGGIRNLQMGMVADKLIAIWDGESKGTKDMISLFKKRKGVENVFVLTVPK